MPLAFSVFSSRMITPKGLQRVMEHLSGTQTETGWKLERNGRVVLLEDGTEDIPDIDKEFLRPVEKALGAPPKSRLVLMFHSGVDQFELRMARAIGIALSEVYPVVLDDHAGTVEKLRPPGVK